MFKNFTTLHQIINHQISIMKKILLSVSALLGVLAADAQQRVPLFEVFTSSTCPPCKPGNAIYEGVVSNKPATDYVSVKFQEYFPGNGDPYCTNETVGRLQYYSINSIPRMEIDGGWDQNAQSFTDALYTQYRAVPAKFTLSGTYTVKGKIVTAKVKYTPLAVPTGAKLYVAIVEDKTQQNVKNNGETMFYNVVKKMLPDQSGTALPVIAVGGKDSTSFTFTFPGTYRLPADALAANRINLATEHSVEDFPELKVVCWIQGSNKEVYQAANLSRISPAAVSEVSNTVGSVSVYPNPANSNVNIDITMKQADQVSASLVSMTGAVVATKTVSCTPGQNKVSFDAQTLANGVYNIIVLDSKNNSFGQMVNVTH